MEYSLGPWKPAGPKSGVKDHVILVLGVSPDYKLSNQGGKRLLVVQGGPIQTIVSGLYR